MELRRMIVVWGTAVADLIWPRKCVVCGSLLHGCRDSLGNWLCDDCLEDIPLTRFWRWEENPAEERMWKRVGIVTATSLFFYRQEGGYGNLVRDVKYYGNSKLGITLGQTLGEYIREGGRLAEEPVQAVVPVPLHPFRKWKRGYNQAEIEAEGIAQALDVRMVPDLLRRKKHTRTQTALDAEEKRLNVKNAFSVNPRIARKLAGEGVTHILVVDDVMTSGATLSAAVTPLMELFSVSVATLGFVE